MNRIYDVAQLVVSSWRLVAGKNFPTSDGLLDKALREAVNKHRLPEWAAKELHFTDSRTGLRCIELPIILELAQNGELTSAPNPSYRYAELKVSERVARVFLRRLDVPEAAAKKLGDLLKATVEEQSSAGEAA